MTRYAVTSHTLSCHGLAIIRVCPFLVAASDSSFVIILVDLPRHLFSELAVTLLCTVDEKK